jgi:hypothetical protein
MQTVDAERNFLGASLFSVFYDKTLLNTFSSTALNNYVTDCILKAGRNLLIIAQVVLFLYH